MTSSLIPATSPRTPHATQAPAAKAPRVFKYNTPKIYVNDGSNGPNIVYAYSYPNYNDGSMPPSVTNNYTNNYKRNEVHSYNSQDGTRLHATADMNGYSDYTISQRVK